MKTIDSLSNWNPRNIWKPLLITALAVTGGFVLPGICRADEPEVTIDEGVYHVQVGGREVIRYQASPHPNRPYIAAWTTPDGRQILLDSPHDHPHHHALMYAIGIKDVDFWAEVPPEKFGRQVPVGPLSVKTDSAESGTTVTLKQKLHWVTPGGERLADESRTITVDEGLIAEASLLTWQLQLAPAPGRSEISLWGRHYFGLGLRMIPAMDRGGRFQFSGREESLSVRGSELLTRADWCAYTASVDGRPVTVAMFDDPKNARSPATWFTMNSPFAYLGATLNLKHERLTVTQQKPLNLRYGLALWDGTPSREAIQAALERWRSKK